MAKASPDEVAVASDLGNQEFPIACSRFVETLQNTHDEVWARHLVIQHERENHTPTEWQRILDSYRDQPAYRPL